MTRIKMVEESQKYFDSRYSASCANQGRYPTQAKTNLAQTVGQPETCPICGAQINMYKEDVELMGITHTYWACSINTYHHLHRVLMDLSPEQMRGLPHIDWKKTA